MATAIHILMGGISGFTCPDVFKHFNLTKPAFHRIEKLFKKFPATLISV
jgi:hypothetical protein